MVLLRLFQQWQKACNEGYEKSFLERNYVRSATMEMIVGMRAQLLGQLRASGFVRSRGSGDIRDLNVNSDKWGVVKAALTAGAYPNIIQRNNRKQMFSAKISKVNFHPSSTLVSLSNSTNSKLKKYIHLFPSDWFIFHEMMNIGNVSYARGCSIVHPFSVALFTGPYRLFSEAFTNQQSKLESDSESEDTTFQDKPIYKIDDWICFRFDLATANLISQLRIKWRSLFSSRMRQPSKQLRPSDECVLKCIIDIITEEEKTLGIPQPTGIGQRPKLMPIDFCPFFDMG
jgi:PREDICTED: similar to YTH domain containing 2